MCEKEQIWGIPDAGGLPWVASRIHLYISPSLSLKAYLWPRYCPNALWGSRCLTAVVTLDPRVIAHIRLLWIFSTMGNRPADSNSHSFCDTPSSPRPASFPLWNPELRRGKKFLFPSSLFTRAAGRTPSPPAKGRSAQLQPPPCSHTSHNYQWPAEFLARSFKA